MNTNEKNNNKHIFLINRNEYPETITDISNMQIVCISN